MDKIPITREGYEKLQSELNRLVTIERKEVIQAIADARAQGDLSENAEYDAARDRQGFIEGRIQELESKMSRFDIIATDGIESDRVQFGAFVKILNYDTDEEYDYRIVGADEADIQHRKISVASPIAKAIIGKTEGDVVRVDAPGGSYDCEIMSVSYS